ncbi:uncharacterized protein M421DRAFT_422094 [Didymella exigua CBS 183.55]|uniref:Uncharacterized protein n=1 Tax=Didymella exigua CBS 183.55 TaxID=1150837 RepID=A0A6A5RG18_9PLEO|nr:uncharacterized protein M421DRAFT_422094 [Didymella exigua CBS 183.55]KAF1927245.1 hypothetical protein M421DRAFT_422094 [Didymella exigua CBS 183.55]
MGALLSLPITLLNFLLPFTKPGTPILQDLIHTIILCGTLYYAPQVAEWYNTRQLGNTTDGAGRDEDQDQNHGEDAQQAEPYDTRQESQRHHQPAFQPQIEDEDEAPIPQPGPLEPPAPQPPHAEQLVPDEGGAGPANERPRATPANRAIGAKKAKSLARKDQRRAYHEFHRQEAELRRLQDAEGRDEREAAAAAEKARRVAAEAEIREAERREREEVKAQRGREASEERGRRERVVESVRSQLVSRGAADLAEAAYTEGKDQLWVERLVRASGILSQSTAGEKVLITSQGWVVRVDKELMEMAYKEAEEAGDKREGKVEFGDFGEMLERAVRARGSR